MFTGLVEELGKLGDAKPYGEATRLRFEARTVVADARPGDSIAVNGVCLTAVDLDDAGFAVDAVPETLSRTSLGALQPGSPVNLERPVTLSARLGGHLVQGHVDGLGRVAERTPGERADTIRVSLPGGLGRYVVAKGSVAVDGVSLTVVDDDGDSFTVSLIPATLEYTTLGTVRPGDPVNLEVDIVAKYVEKLLGGARD